MRRCQRRSAARTTGSSPRRFCSDPVPIGAGQPNAASPILNLVRRGQERAELERREAEIEAARPYLELAREIQAEVARIAADPAAEQRAARRAHRQRAAGGTDEAGPADLQRAPARAAVGRSSSTSTATRRSASTSAPSGRRTSPRPAPAAARLDLVARARAEGRLDTRDVPAGEQLTLGLFREHESRAAVSRGHASSTCARRLVLRAVGDGTLPGDRGRVQPRRRLLRDRRVLRGDLAHAPTACPVTSIVRVGSIVERGAGTGATFEPVLYPAGASTSSSVTRPRRADFTSASVC